MTLTVDARRPMIAGINNYVPALAYDASLAHGAPAAFSLGSPAAASATAVGATNNMQAVAGTVVNYTYTADSPYGRTLKLTISADPGNAHVVDIYGFDWLGQPMIERFTGANGVTSVLYGKKAFYKVTKTVIVTASTNAVTAGIGTHTRLGLPFKGDLAWATEAGVQVPIYKRDVEYSVARSKADAVAGTSVWVSPPFPGFVKSLFGFPGGGGGATDPVIIVKRVTVAIVGLTVTVDTSDTTGVKVTDTPTTLGYNANNRFATGDMIEINAAAAAGAFNDHVGLVLTPTQFTLPDLTDPQTNVLGDPRGLYDPLTAPASTEVVVGLIGDSSVNASGNGGLHGIKHYAA